jgi:hypothetical protein
MVIIKVSGIHKFNYLKNSPMENIPSKKEVVSREIQGLPLFYFPKTSLITYNRYNIHKYLKDFNNYCRIY